MGITEYLADLLLRLAEVPGAQYWFLAAIAGYPALLLVGWFKRRAALQDFAHRHQLRFTSVLPSDKREPFTYFRQVRSAVLLYHVMEGPWESLEMAVADSPQGRRPTWTEVIVRLPADVPPFRLHFGEGGASSRARFGARLDGATLVTPVDSILAAKSVMTSTAPEAAAAALGPRTSELLLAGPPVVIETHFSYLRVSPRRQLQADELPAFLGFAASLVRALVADAQFARR